MQVVEGVGKVASVLFGVLFDQAVECQLDDPEVHVQLKLLQLIYLYREA